MQFQMRVINGIIDIRRESNNRRRSLQKGVRAFEEQTVEEPERVPLLFVDVNLGQGKTERIVVHEGDESAALAEKFAEEHGNFGFLG